VLLWPGNGHINYVSRILFKRIFLRDGRICSSRHDYMRRTDGGSTKKTIKNNHSGKLGGMFVGRGS